MTIAKSIQLVDTQKPNTVPDELKLHWLSVLDTRIKQEIHEAFGDASAFDGYDEYTAMDTELLVPPPYDEIYVHWLAAQIDFAQAEYDRYNVEIAIFDSDMLAYERHYRKTHASPPITPRYV